jgi:3-phytase
MTPRSPEKPRSPVQPPLLCGRRAKLTLLGAAFIAGCASTPPVEVARVAAVRETAPVAHVADAADDPAIWVAPEPAMSLVIATDKQGGLYVFDLAGSIVQRIDGGRPNNVDLRDGFSWSDGAAPIVATSDRIDNTIVLRRFDPVARRLEESPRARVATGFGEVYGVCLGLIGADFVAVATDAAGAVGVWRLQADATGTPRGERIASFSLHSVAEGCVVDDEAGAYYVAEEGVGVWRVSLSDANGSGRRLIDRIGAGRLAADVEGLALWKAANGWGFLIVSVQGASRFAVYARGDNSYVGAFSIGASRDGADAVSGTDGLDVVSANLGPDYPGGLLVVQDDENSDPPASQNFKYVSWADIETALGLASTPAGSR